MYRQAKSQGAWGVRQASRVWDMLTIHKIFPAWLETVPQALLRGRLRAPGSPVSDYLAESVAGQSRLDARNALVERKGQS